MTVALYMSIPIDGIRLAANSDSNKSGGRSPAQCLEYQLERVRAFSRSRRPNMIRCEPRVPNRLGEADK